MSPHSPRLTAGVTRSAAPDRSGGRRPATIVGLVTVIGALVAAMLTAVTFSAAPAEAAPITVRVGAASRQLDGVNVERKANYLVAYTRTATQTSTPTNVYGAEVTIVGGKVASVNDRLVNKGGATTIPAGAVVLSGHDTAREWLVANAKVGATVTAPGLVDTPTSGTTTAPTTTTAAPSSTPALALPSLIPATSSALPVPTTAAPTTGAPSNNSGRWMSGAAGEGVANGQFAAWRGSSLPIVGTWSDGNAGGQQELWSLQPNLEYGNWTGSTDMAIGAIFSGETWGQAASGAFDSRWARSLNQAKSLWKNKSRGTLYLRFAHEWNGNWTQWSVKQSDLANFRTAWQRFYQLKQQIFPEAQLVFCTNGDTVGQTYDWRSGWPGDAFVDVYATDWYAGHWQAYKSDASDRFGGPTGLNTHRQFAEQHGKPFAVAEWGNNTDQGDKPEYIQYMRDFGDKYGGTGSGQLLYEIYFNVIWSPNKFGLYPESRTGAPQAARRYQQVF